MQNPTSGIAIKISVTTSNSGPFFLQKQLRRKMLSLWWTHLQSSCFCRWECVMVSFKSNKLLCMPLDCEAVFGACIDSLKLVVSSLHNYIRLFLLASYGDGYDYNFCQFYGRWLLSWMPLGKLFCYLPKLKTVMPCFKWHLVEGRVQTLILISIFLKTNNLHLVWLQLA